MADTYVTLGEAGNLRQAFLDAVVIQTVSNMSPVLAGGINVPGGATPAALPFRIISDRTLTIVREAAEPTVSWYDPGEKVTGEELDTTQTSFTVRGLKTRVPVPREIKQGYASLVDQIAAQLRFQLKGITTKLMKGFYYGDNATNSKEPSGIHKLASTTGPDMTIAESSSDTASALNLTNLDDLLSRMKEGADMLVCGRQLWRRFTAAARNTATGVSGLVRYSMNQIGMPMPEYAGVPIFPDDYIVDTEATSSDIYNAETGGSGSSLFALKFGPDHLHGISFAQASPVVSLLKGPTQDYDGDIIWVTWDVGFVMRSPYAIGVIEGIDPSAAIAA